MKKGGDDEDEKKGEPKREEFVEAPPEPPSTELSSTEQSLEERNILSVAFKNVVGTRRAAWRVLSSIEKKENNKGNAHNVEKVKNYKRQIEEELTRIC
jgi:hypothetical protein